MVETQLDTSQVNFVVAGVQKGGTKALHFFLSQHPEIGLVSGPKDEPHFFDDEQYFQTTPDYQRYHSLFSPELLSRITGDVTPIYSYWMPCMARIKDYNPHMKIIVLLRNPVSRAYSQWNMEHSKGLESDPFLRAILKEPFRRGFTSQHPIYSYLHRGFYSRQIENVLKHFPREQCLFIKSEDLKQNHHATLQRVLSFLQLSTELIATPDLIHSGNYSPLPAWLKRVLTLYYRRDIKRLARLTGMDFSNWLHVE